MELARTATNQISGQMNNSGIRTSALIFAIATLVTHLAHVAMTLDYWTSLDFQDGWNQENGFFIAVLDLSFILGILGATLLLIGLIKGGKSASLFGSIVLAVRFVFFYMMVNVYLTILYADIGLDPDFETFWIPVLDFFTKEPSEPLEFFTFLFSIHLALISGALGLISQRGQALGPSNQTVRFEDSGSTSNSMTERTATMTETKFCSGCGQPATDTKFCANCGTPSGGTPAVNVGAASTSVPKTNTLAIVALIISFFVPIVGMILAYSARKEIDTSNGLQTGRGLTTGAIVLNWIWILFVVLFVFSTGLLLTL